MSEQEREPELTIDCRGIDHIAFRVSSLEASLPYYAALLPLLGFAPAGEAAWRNEAGLLLHFSEAEEGARPYDRYGAGMNHLGFTAPSPAAVAAVRDGMAAAGFPVPEIQTISRATALFMKDPDGIRFEVSCLPAREEAR
jgi:catechol 2,3-dioxygenase-like lactoylglutathione lyase family enzyme